VAFNLLDKSPEAAKMLVSLHDKQKLYALAKENNPDAKEELVSVMADLLTVELSFSEVELVTDVLLNLIQQAEKDLRAAISERVSVMDELPLRLALTFANDDIEVANPILRFSQVLNDTDLIYIVKSQGAEHWRSIATRKEISPMMIDMLADTNDLETALNITKNDHIVLTDHSMTLFSEMTADSQALADGLLKRSEFPQSLVSKVYELVGQELKEEIKTKYELPEFKQVENIIEDIVFEFVEKEDESEPEPSCNMIVAAEMMMAKGKLTPHIMVQNLKRGQIQNFMAMLSVYCGLPFDTVTEILKQNSGQGLAVASKALNIIKPDFINMYLLTARLRGNEIIKQEDLNSALSYFDKITQDEAKRILNESRH